MLPLRLFAELAGGQVVGIEANQYTKLVQSFLGAAHLHKAAYEL